MHAARSHWQAGLLFSLLTSAQWGLVPIFLKALQPTLGSGTLVWCRVIVPALAVGAYFLFKRRDVAWRPLFHRSNWLMLAIAIIGLLGNYLLFMLGLQHVPADAAQLVGQLGPLLLLIGGVVLFKEPFSPLQWIGLAAAIIGLGLFFHQPLSHLGLDAYSLGLLWIVGASAVWSAFGLAQKKLGRSANAQQSLLVIYVAGSLAYLPAVEFSGFAKLDGLGIAMLAWASLSSGLAYVTLAAAMKHWDAARVSAMLTTTPLFALLFTAIAALLAPGHIEASPLDWLSGFGAVVLVIGSGIAAIARRRPQMPT
jgi:drug/metabolite transporter (DMT)-like permease